VSSCGATTSEMTPSNAPRSRPSRGKIGRAGAAGAWYCKDGEPLPAGALNSVVPLLARPTPLASECASNVVAEDTFYHATNATL
jgi:hypothetical protein